MAKRKGSGFCHICGNYRELTKEHTPMKEAFNKNSYISAGPKDIVQRIIDPLLTGTPPRGKVEQGGVSDYTLCGKCNNDTGSWYGGQYLSWCRKGMEILMKSGGRPSLIYIYNVYPLAIIKQISSLFCSINPPTIAQRNAELRKFLLDKEAKGLPQRFRYYCFFCIEDRNTAIGNAYMVNFETGISIPISQFSCPPFGYVMTINSKPPDRRLFEITHFSKYGYYEIVDMKLKINALTTDAILPGLYFDNDEIRALEGN